MDNTCILFKYISYCNINLQQSQYYADEMKRLLLLKKVGNAKTAKSAYTPFQSEDSSPAIPTRRKKEEKGKTVEDKNGASSLGQSKIVPMSH